MISQTKIIMGFPIEVSIADKNAANTDIKKIFDYFISVDKKFSTYKKNSEISKINSQIIDIKKISSDMKKVFKLSGKTKIQSYGYFDIQKNGVIDPSGIVKGWAILNASKILKSLGFKNFFINAGGDIQTSGKNSEGKKWTVGIRNPNKTDEIVKVLNIKNKGVATSGNYERGEHIYSPKENVLAGDVISITVIGPNILEADRFATAAFAMGKKGIEFIEKLKGLEGYMIDKNGMATYTSGFEKYI